MPKIIIISGMLAAGKSLLADELSDSLSIACYKKDTYKEMLVDKYGFNTREENRALSIKAVELIFSYVQNHFLNNQDVIVEANFRKDEIEKLISIYKDYVIFDISGDQRILYDRFLKRIPTRHKAHLSMHLDKDYNAFELYNENLEEEIKDFKCYKIDSTKLNKKQVLKKALSIIKKN